MAWQPCHSNPGVGLDDRKEVTFWVIGLSFLWNGYGDRGRFQHIMQEEVWGRDKQHIGFGGLTGLGFSPTSAVLQGGWTAFPAPFTFMCSDVTQSCGFWICLWAGECLEMFCRHPRQLGFIPLTNSSSTSAPTTWMHHLGLRSPPSAKTKFTLIGLNFTVERDDCIKQLWPSDGLKYNYFSFLRMIWQEQNSLKMLNTLTISCT